MITAEEVKHIAKLAKLNLSPEEVEKFTKQLAGIFNFVEQLNEVDTTNVIETSQTTGLQNVKRLDEVEFCEYETALVQCTPNDIEDNSVKIPKIL